MLEVNGCLKMIEVDNYDEGCLLEGGLSVWIDETWKAQTPEQLISDLAKFCGIDAKDVADSIELNACDEAGRINIARTENIKGNKPSAQEMKAFKQGKIKLFYCVYSFKVQEVTRNAFTFAVQYDLKRFDNVREHCNKEMDIIRKNKLDGKRTKSSEAAVRIVVANLYPAQRREAIVAGVLNGERELHTAVSIYRRADFVPFSKRQDLRRNYDQNRTI